MSNSTAFLSPCDRLEILRRIECVCLALRAQSQKKQPFLIEIDHPLTHNTRIVTLNNRNVTVAHILRVLSAVYKVVLQQTNTTLRALYYQNRDLFLTQSISNLTVSLCSQLLRVRRPLLLIFATGKGVVWGPIQLLDHTSKVMGSAYTTRAPHGLRISDSISFVRGLSFRPAMGTTINDISDIQFILVVEKESAFNKIVEEIMQQQHKFGRPVAPFVMVSGNGMPSLAARELVRKLRARLMVPVFGMFDCNPDGIGIMLTYLHTSNASVNSLGWLSNRSDYVIPEINWLGIGINHVELEAQHRGLHAKDIEKIASGRHSNRDTSRFNSLKDHPMVENNVAMNMELNKMEHSAIKFEIDQISYTTLLDLIEDGVQQQMYTVVR